MGTFHDLIDNARDVVVGATGPVSVAALDDVIASKRAADRAKDRRVLPELEALRRQQRDIDRHAE